jgi:hypothetical protein
MKIIMLDIDGVMNSWQSAYWYRKMIGNEEEEWVNYKAVETKEDEEFGVYTKELCPMACCNLRQVLEYHPDARIVISSTWRHGRTVEWFNKLFKHFKIFTEDKVIGITPVLRTQRGYEIEDWLNKTEEKVEEFVIIDDDGDMGPYIGTYHFIKTNGKVGFDYLIMEAIDKVFDKFVLKFKDLKPGVPYKMYSKPRNTNYFKDGDGMAYFGENGKLSRQVSMYPDRELFSEVLDD